MTLNTNPVVVIHITADGHLSNRALAQLTIRRSNSRLHLRRLARRQSHLCLILPPNRSVRNSNSTPYIVEYIDQKYTPVPSSFRRMRTSIPNSNVRSNISTIRANAHCTRTCSTCVLLFSRTKQTTINGHHKHWLLCDQTDLIMYFRGQIGETVFPLLIHRA